jgi:hypothetical protein
MQQNTTEHPSGNATMPQDVLDSEDTPARHGSYPAVQHAAAEAAEAACTADVAAALAEAFCGSTANALSSSFQVNDCWQTHVTAGPHAAAANAAGVPAQQQLDAMLQTDVLFDVCTAMEGLDGSCCSCSSTHDISSAEELEQLLEHELRAAAAAAPGNWTPAYTQLQQQASMPKESLMRKESYNMLGGRNGYQLLPAQGSMQLQQQTIRTPCWQHPEQQQQGVGVPAGLPAPSFGFGHFAETPPMQQLGMQQQQQLVVNMPESNAGIGVGGASGVASVQQRLDHLQEMQQQLEQMQSMMAVVQLKRQQAAALLDTADAAAAAAVAPGFGAGLQMPMLRRTTATQDAAAVEPAVGMGVGLQVPSLQRTLTLESSSNGFCAGATWASFMM